MFKVKFPSCKACNHAVATLDEKQFILPKTASIDARNRIVTFETSVPLFAKEVIKEFQGELLTK